MNDKRSLFLYWCATAFVLCFFFLQPAQAQTPKQNEDNQTIQTLLAEVRLLRKTMQQTGLSACRGQIILEGLRARNDKVERLTRMLEEARNQVEHFEQTVPRMAEQAKLYESQLAQEPDANRRASLEFEIKERKRDVERYKVLAERAREREQQLSAQLRAEQTKLAEMEGRLDALEREIEGEVERQRSEDASPRESKKQL